MGKNKILCFDDNSGLVVGGIINSWNKDVLTNPNSEYLQGDIEQRGPFSVHKNIGNYEVFARANTYKGNVRYDLLSSDEVSFRDELLFKGIINIFKDSEINFSENIFYALNIPALSKMEREKCFGDNPLEYIIFGKASTERGKINRLRLIIKGYEKNKEERDRQFNAMRDFARNVRETHPILRHYRP